MLRHRDCITDPLARALWREYKAVVRNGQSLGLSFIEYVAARVHAVSPGATVTSGNGPFEVGGCGHKHPWGGTCATETIA